MACESSRVLNSSKRAEHLVVKVSAFLDDESLIIDVSDCGCGIPADLQKEIFRPFFTTKKEGIGLGLAIVKKITEAHQGRLETRQNQGKGVTLRTILPLRKSN
ncbi:MAG: hypothetical protein JRJ12_04850 [Deltaproteobacteria bacterium]|nr:hypothetical protein [Deltaproteobacteria bacterium]MBW2072079.1 hypothetical protein [Deltaproteobacteria bacterium]